jgi:hypothetical protein
VQYLSGIFSGGGNLLRSFSFLGGLFLSRLGQGFTFGEATALLIVRPIAVQRKRICTAVKIVIIDDETR